MAQNNRQASVDELAMLMADLVDHVEVLVAAVGELRCEVENQCRVSDTRHCGRRV